jgi:hypothetical protein
LKTKYLATLAGTAALIEWRRIQEYKWEELKLRAKNLEQRKIGGGKQSKIIWVV